MTLWNLIIVLCFAVLYLGLALVFGQLRRLRDEVLLHVSTREFPDPTPPLTEEDPLAELLAAKNTKQPVAHLSEEGLTVLRQDLTTVQNRLITAINAIPARLAPELEGLHRQMQEEVESISRQIQSMERNLSRFGRTSNNESGNSSTNSGDDPYSEAKLLLANGVDEDRVIEKTGLTVEEVSLLKRISRNQDRP